MAWKLKPIQSSSRRCWASAVALAHSHDLDRERCWGKHAKVGNFVETKKAHLGEGSKINHLSYIGDAELGDHVNVGAGTITCNYDGVNKHLTQIGNEAFIGSNSTLIAPVEIGDGGFVAAGTTLTKNVNDAELAVGRAKQRNIAGWQRPIKKED